FTNCCVKKVCSSVYRAASTLPALCASPKKPAPVKPSLPFFAIQVRNINQHSSIAIGLLPIISIQIFRWKPFWMADVKLNQEGRNPLSRKILNLETRKPGNQEGGFLIRPQQMRSNGQSSK